MEDFTKLTPIELQKKATDLKAEHEQLKKDISDNTYKIEELEKNINEKLARLEEVEKEYVAIVEEVDKR